MTRVRVRYIGNFRDVVGKEEETIQISGKKIEDVVADLGNRYGNTFLEEIMDLKTKKLLTSYVFLLNGNNVFSIGGLEAEVKDGDTVSFVAMVGGG